MIKSIRSITTKSMTVLLVYVLIFSISLLPTWALAEDTKFNGSIDNSTTGKSLSEPIKEEKIYSVASVNEDFSPNSLIVTMKNSISLRFTEYNVENFPEVNAVSVENLSPYTYEAVKNKYEALLAENIEIENKDSLFNKHNYLLDNINNSKSNLTSYLNDNNFIPLLNKMEGGVSVFDAKTKQNELKLVIKNYINDLDNKYDYLKDYDYSDYHLSLKITLGTNDKQNVIDAIHKLEARDDVLSVTPNYYGEFDAVVNDEYVSEQWYLDRIDYFDSLEYVGNTETVTVGILDSGINASNPDLANKVDVNLSKSFIDNDTDPLNDTYGHGTCVAGIIGACSNNEIGITGICNDINMVSLKVGNSYPEHAYVQLALDYAEANDIDLINCSFQLAGYSQAYYEQMKDVFDVYSGFIISAAGNENKNMDNTGNIYYFPLALDYENIITVAATDENDELAKYDADDPSYASNYGITTVDLAAPGKNIYTTSADLDEGYRSFKGTSSAAPIVTGVAALIKSLHPDISNSQLRSFILNNVDAVNSLSGKVATGGIINVNKILSDINKKKYIVQYDANGGTGAAMDNSIVYYGVNKRLSPVTYTNLDYRFVGWTAHRNSDNKWLYTDNNGNNRWYVENSQPDGYVKFLYNNCARIAKTSNVNNDIITFYAQWEKLSLGDINMDGRVSIEDASLLQKYLSEMVEFTEQQERLADVNMDGRINVFDVTEIQRIIAAN